MFYILLKSVAVIVVNHDRRLGVDTVAMCCYLSPVSRSPDVTVVDMLQARGRGSGWIINTGGTLSPGHSGCVGGWPRLSPSLTDPQLAVPAQAPLSVSLSAPHAVIVCYSRLLLPNCWPARRVTSLARGPGSGGELTNHRAWRDQRTNQRAAWGGGSRAGGLCQSQVDKVAVTTTVAWPR